MCKSPVVAAPIAATAYPRGSSRLDRLKPLGLAQTCGEREGGKQVILLKVLVVGEDLV
jgi:hypothetical protein